MAKRRRKKRTHAQITPEQEQGISMPIVIRVGQTSLANHSLIPIRFTHLFMFTQSEKTGNVSLKIARTLQGPIVTFQVSDYSLGKYIKKVLKKLESLNNDDISDPPFLILNGFSTSKESGEKNQDVNLEKIIVFMFQNISLPFNSARAPLKFFKRVFMINKETGEISMGHHFTDIREVDTSRNLKRLYKAKKNLSRIVPNPHRKEDIP